ncbi:MAG: hypothetical protein RBT63_06200, partial [Bdellovibrionales bacterium]|nr:hypothetical protein [Bdellovibrionales bacterium]
MKVLLSGKSLFVGMLYIAALATMVFAASFSTSQAKAQAVEGRKFLERVETASATQRQTGRQRARRNSEVRVPRSSEVRVPRSSEVRVPRSSEVRVPRNTKLSTQMSFSGSRVGGQYQIPAEATARIENEKPIEELLGLRTQFRDRMKQDEER